MSLNKIYAYLFSVAPKQQKLHLLLSTIMRSAASVIASDLSTTTTATTTITTTAAVATATTTTTRAIIKPALRNLHDRGSLSEQPIHWNKRFIFLLIL